MPSRQPNVPPKSKAPVQSGPCWLPPSPPPRCEERVRGAAGPAFARTPQEQADSLSDEPLCEEVKPSMEILVQEKDPALYRCDWESSWGGKFGSFRDYTCVRAMLFTCKPTPAHAGVKPCLQVFSIRVMETNECLEGPLEVYGLVATRDSVDHNRNIIFRRERDDCQFLTEQGSLMPTGPSRAVVFTALLTLKFN